jgi:hypothetical protein
MTASASRLWPRDVPAPGRAPRGEHERRPALALPDRTNDPVYLKGLLSECRELETDMSESMLTLCALLCAVIYTREKRPADHGAERRILGALFLGRATLGDVGALVAADFDGTGHSTIFATLTAALEVMGDDDRGEMEAEPRLPRLRPRPSVLATPTEARQEIREPTGGDRLDAPEVGTGPRGRGRICASETTGPDRRRRLVAIVRASLKRGAPPDAAAAIVAIDALPWPRDCPRAEVERVSALGAWRRGN